MITTEDIALIISPLLAQFGMPIYVKGHIPFGKIPSEGRITILPKTDDDGKIFNKCFVEVNFILPDVEQEANAQLDTIERDAYNLFRKGMAGKLNGQWYNISYSRRSREEDKDLESHYVHFQLSFDTLNIL